MSLNVDFRVLTQPGATGNQTLSLPSNFDPKAIILMAVPAAADGSIANWNPGIGFGTYRGGAVQQRYAFMTGQDAAATSIHSRGQGSTSLLQVCPVNSSVADLEIDLISMQTGATSQVVINWVNLHTTASIRVLCWILGGSDITDALVGSYTVLDTGVTTQDVTVASGFGQPDLVFFLGSANLDTGAVDSAHLFFGWGRKGTDGRGWGWSQAENTTSIASVSFRENRCINVPNSNLTTYERAGRLSATGGWPADGFELTWDAAPVFADVDGFLALKGTFQTADGAANANQNPAPVDQDLAVGFTPKAAMFINWGRAAATVPVIADNVAADAHSIGLGGTDFTDEAWMGWSEDDALGTMDSNQQSSTSRAIRIYSGAAAILAEADSSVSGGTNIRLSWQDTDASSRQFQWLAFGDAAGGGTVDFAAAITGVATVAPQLAVDRALAASVSGLATIAAQLRRDVPIACDITGVGTVAADLGKLRLLQADVAGQGTIAAQLATARALNAAVTGLATIAADLTRTAALAAAVNGQGAVTADPRVDRALAAAIQSVATITADLSTAGGGTTVSLAAAVDGLAAITAELARSRPIAADITGVAALTANLARTVALQAGVQGDATVTATAAETRGLATSVLGFATIAADLGIVGQAIIHILRRLHGWGR